MAAALLPTFGMEGRLSQRCHSWYTQSANKARRGRERCERDERGARRRSDCCGSVRLGSRAGQARHAAVDVRSFSEGARRRGDCCDSGRGRGQEMAPDVHVFVRSPQARPEKRAPAAGSFREHPSGIPLRTPRNHHPPPRPRPFCLAQHVL